MDNKNALPPADRRKFAGSAKAVGAYLMRVAKASFEAHGFPSAELLAQWPAIVGDDLAAFTAPERLIWPRRHASGMREDQTREQNKYSRESGATLVVRVQGPRAIEVQHDTPRIIERVNAGFGYRAVTALRIIQGPVVRETVVEEKKQPEPAPDETGLDRIGDDRLRGALARLASRVNKTGE